METFFNTLKIYYSHILSSNWNLLFPILMLVSFVLLTFIISWIYVTKRIKPDNEEVRKATIIRKILCAMYISGIVTLAITTAVVILLQKFSQFFADELCQFGVIIGFFVMGIIVFLVYLMLCRAIKSREMMMYKVPISRNALNVKFSYLKSVLSKKLLLGFFILVAPFLLLLISYTKTTNLAIVLDNSGSMSGDLPYISESLQQTLIKSPSGHFVFTTLDITNYPQTSDTTLNQYYNSIINSKSVSQLPTTSESFANAQLLLTHLSGVGDAGGSPIYQGIWQNYLLAREEFSKDTPKKLIIISDGEDNLYFSSELEEWDKKDIFQQKGQVDQTPAEFFDDGIFVINYGVNDGRNLFTDCENSITVIYDGYDQQSYFNAFVNILGETYFDWILIYILIGLLSLTYIALLISKSFVR